MAYVPQCGPRGLVVQRRAFAAWSALTLLALLLAASLFAAPWASAHGHTALAQALYDGFAYVCHQIPSRSFHFEGHPLAVCARCTGIYAGFALGVLLYPLARPLARAEAPRRLWLFIAAGPITLDFLLGWLGIWENTHFSRLLTGAFFGAVCAFFVVPACTALGQRRLARDE